MNTQAEINYAESVKKSLSRAVFDVLLERDLLGFLLSSKHFQIFLMKMELEADTEILSLAREIFSDALKIKDFHDYMLSMFNGIYIKESSFETSGALIANLDVKLADLFVPGADIPTVGIGAVNHVELAWRYRHSCGGNRYSTV